MIKKIFLLFLLPVFLLACEGEAGASSRTLSIVSQDGTRHVFKVELALTPQQQQQGLMNRTEMAEDAGMLFFFGDEEPRSFWMKNTLIPLDIVFIKSDGTILNIHENARPHDLTSIKSSGPVAAALEINGGESAKRRISAGDKVEHVLFGKSSKTR